MTAKQKLDAAQGLEAAALAMLEDFKYMPIGSGEQRAVLLLEYLLPLGDMALFLAERGWRRHDELAILKPRSIVGGVFEDLVAYVPVDQPDDPIIVGKDPMPDRTQPPVMPDLWSVKPVVSETFEERPDES